MTNRIWTTTAGFVACAALAPLSAQAPATPQTPAAARMTADQKQSRYQIGMMERVLEGAVEHGVTNIRDRLQTIGPTELLMSDNAKARGFRLDGYGVFFDVLVPTFDTTSIWAARTLEQNDLGLQNALKTLQAHIQADGDPGLQQALRRVELQVEPIAMPRVASVAGSRDATGAAATIVDTTAASTSSAASGVPATPSTADPIFTDPDEAYRKEVVAAVMDAMLDHSSALGIGPDEWLTVAARRNEERPRLAPADTDSRTIVIRLKGSDLSTFLARKISKEEALGRFEVRVF
jgi:hypothetical protein